MTDNEILDDISARLSALEFMVRQLFSAHLRADDRDPFESASALQLSAATNLRETLDAMEEGPAKARMQQLNGHVTRIFEDLIRGFEQDEN